jgi:hypothetical protein
MALEVVYEGSAIAGIKNVTSRTLQHANVVVEPGRICTLSHAAGPAVQPGYVYFGGGDLDTTADKPFGLCADYKQDVIASGKVSVYNTPGLYKTSMHNSPAKGDVLTFDVDGLLTTVSGNSEYIVGICTESADSSGMIEMFLNITGSVA